MSGASKKEKKANSLVQILHFQEVITPQEE